MPAPARGVCSAGESSERGPRPPRTGYYAYDRSMQHIRARPGHVIQAIHCCTARKFLIYRKDVQKADENKRRYTSRLRIYGKNPVNNYTAQE